MNPLIRWSPFSFLSALFLIAFICSDGFAMSVSASNIQFNGVTLNGTDQVTSGSTDAWRIDASDSANGWNVSVSMTDFINESDDILGAGNCEIRLSAENITIISGDNGPYSTQTNYTPIGVNAVKIVASDEGFGIGIYDIKPEFTLMIPAQTYAGTYSTTVTISVVAGP